MNQHDEDLIAVAKDIIDSTLYMVLGTSDEAGQPWVSPVYFTASKYKEFYWVSSPETKHSRNIAKRPQISIVVFNSQVPVGKAQAVYMSAAAQELTSSELERGLVVYNGRFPDPAWPAGHQVFVSKFPYPLKWQTGQGACHSLTIRIAYPMYTYRSTIVRRPGISSSAAS